VPSRFFREKKGDGSGPSLRPIMASVPTVSGVSVFAGMVNRTWRVGPRRLAVSLQHNTITGARNLYVDGEEVPGAAGSSSVFSRSASISFATPDGWRGTVSIEFSGTSVCYKCGVVSPEGGPTMHVPEDNAGGGGGGGASGGDDGGSAGPLFRISVDAPEMGSSETGEPVVFYCVSTTRLSDGLATRVHRRFRDFFALNDAVRAAYQGSHLMGSLPEPPPRGLKFLENHGDAAFVERRRWLLADYLFKLEAVPRVRANADFVAFLGLVGSVRETSCFFPANAPLGLSLGKKDGLTEVQALKPLADGRPSVSMLSGVIVVGDTVRGGGGAPFHPQTHTATPCVSYRPAPRSLRSHFPLLPRLRPAGVQGQRRGRAFAVPRGAAGQAKVRPPPPPCALFGGGEDGFWAGGGGRPAHRASRSAARTPARARARGARACGAHACPARGAHLAAGRL